MNNQPNSEINDDIELRSLIKLFWKARVLIIFVSISFSIAAFIFNYWILPKSYIANANISIGQPVLNFANNIFSTVPRPPDLNTIIQISNDPALVDSISNDPSFPVVNGKENLSISDKTKASGVGANQIILQVTDTDPQRAAFIANAWAAKVTKIVNETYGIKSIAANLEISISKSKQDYENNQSEFEAAISNNSVNTLSAQFNREQADLKCDLDSLSLYKRLIKDLNGLENELNSLPADSAISTSNGIILMNLRQRANTSTICQPGQVMTLQLDSSSFSSMDNMNGLEEISKINKWIDTQIIFVKSDQQRLEQEIPLIQKDLITAQNMVDEATLNRDISLGVLKSLLTQQKLIKAILAQGDSDITKVIVLAVPSKTITISNVLVNTAAAGIMGLIIVCLYVLLQNWWKNE